MRHLTLRIACFTGLTAVLAACTGTSHSTQPKSIAPSSSHPSPSLSAPPSAADIRAAKHAILKLTDLGSGFIETPYQPTAQSDRDEAILNTCIGRPFTTAHQTALVYSMQFSKGDSEKIFASITFVDTDMTAQEDTAALRDSRGEKCTKQSFVKQMAEVGDTATATISTLWAIHLSGPDENRPLDAVVVAAWRTKILRLVRSAEYPRARLRPLPLTVGSQQITGYERRSRQGKTYYPSLLTLHKRRRAVGRTEAGVDVDGGGGGEDDAGSCKVSCGRRFEDVLELGAALADGVQQCGRQFCLLFEEQLVQDPAAGSLGRRGRVVVAGGTGAGSGRCNGWRTGPVPIAGAVRRR